MPPSFVHTGRLLGTGIPIVNRAHPLARGQLAAYVPAMAPSGKIINLARPGSGDLVTRGTASYLKMTPEGPGLNSTVNNSGAWGPAPASFQQANNVSVFARGLFLGNANNNQVCPFICVTYSTTVTPPYIAYGVGSGPQSLSGSLLGSIGCFYTAGGGAGFQSYGGSVAPTSGAMLSAGGSWGSAAGSNKVYANGVQNALAGSQAPTFTYSSPQINLGIWSPDPSDASRISLIVITVAYIWSRVLTDGEMRHLDANPYALLLFSSDWVSLAAAPLASGGTAVVADFGCPIETSVGLLFDGVAQAETLVAQRGDPGLPDEFLGGAISVASDAALPIAFPAVVRWDTGTGAAAAMIRRFSRPALSGRVRRLFFPGRPGTLAVESEAMQRADPGAPIEDLGS
jgi:hypothetical protein